MKNIILYTILLVYPFSLISQITISALENIPIEGNEKAYSVVDVDGSFNPGDSGANVVWDFTNLTESDIITHQEFIDSSGLPYHQEVALNDIALKTNNSTNSYTYYNTQDGTKFEISGWWINSSSGGAMSMYCIYKDNMGLPKPLEIISYPITYSSTFTNEYIAEIIIPMDSNITIQHDNGVVSSEVDGWGKLVLPHITYNNALRIHRHNTFDNVTYIQGVPQNSGGSFTIIDSFAWYVPEVKGSVFDYTASIYESGNSYYFAKWYKEFTNLVSETTYNNGIKVFPNPTNGVFNIISKSDFLVSVTDISGRIIYQTKNLLKEIQIDLSSQKKGVYLVEIIQNYNVIIKKIIVK